MLRTPRHVVLGLTATGLVMVGAWAVAAPSGAAATRPQRTWAAASPAASTPVSTPPDAPAGEAPDITGAQRLVIVARDAGRSATVDVGANGDSPGDYYVFQEQLTSPDGAVLGIDSARCMTIARRNTRCEASFLLAGRGSIDVAGAFTPAQASLAVTGGTGAFRNARGQATIVGGTASSTRFVFALLP